MSNPRLLNLLLFGAGIAVGLTISAIKGKPLSPLGSDPAKPIHTGATSGEGSPQKETDPHEQMRRKLEYEREIAMGISTKKPEANFRLVSRTGRVTKEALKNAGIPLDKEKDVQRLIDSLWTTMDSSILRRAKVDPNKSKPEQNISAYIIPADRDEGDRLLQEFEIELNKIAGNQGGEILMSALHPRQYFGWFGKLDMEIEVLPMPGDPSSLKYKYVGTDPASGTIVVRGEADEENFNSQFGKFSDSRP